MVYTLRFFFPLQNAVCFIILTYLIPILVTFYIQSVLKLKKHNSGAKRLMKLQFAQRIFEVSVGSEMFHTDGRMVRKTDRQTDTTKVIVAFRNFADTPRKGEMVHVYALKI